jgi:hypothetical protein
MTALFGKHHDPAPLHRIDGRALGGSPVELVDEVRRRLASAGALVRGMVITRPALALGAALATGVMFGWLIKRR